MSRRLIFTGGVQADVTNRYTPGSGVGSRSTAVRRALLSRAANTCCTYNSKTNCHTLPGGGGGGGSTDSIDVGFWIEALASANSYKLLDNIKAIFKARNSKDGTKPGVNPKILVLRLNSGARPTAKPKLNDLDSISATHNGNFYGADDKDGSFANWAKSNIGLLDSVEEIYILPYQDANSGFAESNITPDAGTLGSKPGDLQYLNDLWEAANFINNKWKGRLPLEIKNKVKGIVFEVENSSLVGTTREEKLMKLNISLNGTFNINIGTKAPVPLANWGLTSDRISEGGWQGTGTDALTGMQWAITGSSDAGDATKSYPMPDKIAPTLKNDDVYYWREYYRYFPQIYNVGNLIVPGSQSKTNQNFWNKTNKDWQKGSSYSRMFSLEGGPNGDQANSKWGKAPFSSDPSLAGVIQYISQQGGLGRSMLFMPYDFDYSAPLIG